MTTKSIEQVRDELAEIQFNTKQHDSEMETTSKIMRGIFKLGFDAAVEHLKAEHQKTCDAFCIKLMTQAETAKETV